MRRSPSACSRAPRAAHDEIAWMRNGALVVRVSVPPVDGRANDALRCAG